MNVLCKPTVNYQSLVDLMVRSPGTLEDNLQKIAIFEQAIEQIRSDMLPPSQELRQERSLPGKRRFSALPQGHSAPLRSRSDRKTKSWSIAISQKGSSTESFKVSIDIKGDLISASQIPRRHMDVEISPPSDRESEQNSPSNSARGKRRVQNFSKSRRGSEYHEELGIFNDNALLKRGSLSHCHVRVPSANSQGHQPRGERSKENVHSISFLGALDDQRSVELRRGSFDDLRGDQKSQCVSELSEIDEGSLPSPTSLSAKSLRIRESSQYVWDMSSLFMEPPSSSPKKRGKLRRKLGIKFKKNKKHTQSLPAEIAKFRLLFSQYRQIEREIEKNGEDIVLEDINIRKSLTELCDYFDSKFQDPFFSKKIKKSLDVTLDLNFKRRILSLHRKIKK